jgi:hypothetical protein
MSVHKGKEQIFSNISSAHGAYLNGGGIQQSLFAADFTSRKTIKFLFVCMSQDLSMLPVKARPSIQEWLTIFEVK